MAKKRPFDVHVRLTEDEKGFVQRLAGSLGVTESELMRRCLWYFRLMLADDLPFWKVVEAALPKIIEEREKILSEMEVRVKF